MLPEQQLTIMLILEEEDGRDMLHALNEVFADQEAADCKGRTGTYPFFNFVLVCIIEWYGNPFLF